MMLLFLGWVSLKKDTQLFLFKVATESDFNHKR